MRLARGGVQAAVVPWSKVASVSSSTFSGLATTEIGASVEFTNHIWIRVRPRAARTNDDRSVSCSRLDAQAVPSSETDPDCSWPKLQSGPSVFTRIARFKSVF